jgi:hypothetical protein
MSDVDKICPKCKTAMEASQLVLGIPAIVPSGMHSKAINDQRAYPVGAYACSKYRFVELYYVPMRR